MPEEKHVTSVSLLFGGDCPPGLMEDLLEIEVNQSLFLPDMFTILIKDGGSEFQWVDHMSFEIGNEVEIKFEADVGGGNVVRNTLVKGEITGLEPAFVAAGRTALLVRGYSRAHRLHRGKHTRTFLKMTDSQMVQKVAKEAGLKVTADSTPVTYDWVLQNNQTNMEFLQARAARLGYSVWVADETLFFKKATANRGTGPDLKFGDALYSFTPRLAATHQADKVTVRGWNPKGKQAISATVEPDSALNQGGVGKTGGAVARAAFEAAEAVVTDQPLVSPDDAKAQAAGLSGDLARNFIHAEGTCSGDPRLQAGCEITIEGVGKRFSGKYCITSVNHQWTPSGYDAAFTISGRRPETFDSLLGPNGAEDRRQGLMRGVMPALVTNLNDPDRLGRIKVKYAALGDQIESDWIRVAAPMAGKGRGLCAMPEVDDEALVAFEHGDPHRPYAIGFLWSSLDRLPESDGAAVENGQVKKRIFKSKSGHVIVLDDSSGKESITIRDKSGQNEIVLNSPENSIEIRAQKDLTIKAQGAVTIQGASVKVEAKEEASLNGATVQVEAKGEASLNGATVQVEAKGAATLSGANVQIKGSDTVLVKGQKIALN